METRPDNPAALALYNKCGYTVFKRTLENVKDQTKGRAREPYRQVQRAPGYVADLDLRAFYHDTLLASACTCQSTIWAATASLNPWGQRRNTEEKDWPLP